MNSSADTKNTLKRVKKRHYNLLEQVFYSRHRILSGGKGKATKNARTRNFSPVIFYERLYQDAE